MTETRPSFVYKTYIASTPEKVFAALTDPEMTRRYWGHHRNVSDWRAGSRWEHRHYDDPAKVDIVGKVVESDPPRKLVVTWVQPQDEGDARKTSRVTFLVATAFGSTVLTVLHEDLEPGSEMELSIGEGWPAILSSLKSLLETGRHLPETDIYWDCREAG